MDYSEHTTAARIALQKAEAKALLREYPDALSFADQLVREARALRSWLMNKAALHSLPQKR